ncbi:MAG: hypothetical protein HWN68_00475 [Desulfobacterales bacterium]|nr:hypothetical protein [Desulfobacterales bacterium]
MKKVFTVHPFLFALYPILHLYSKNIEQVSFYVILLPCLVLVLATFFLLQLGRICCADKQKAAFCVSSFLIYFFSYAAVRSLIMFEVAGFKLYRHRYFIIIWTLVFLAVLLISLRSRLDYNNVTRFFNIFASVLILFPLIGIVSHQFKKSLFDRKNMKFEPDQYSSHSLQTDNLPDIYYIILDGYGRNKDLKRYLNFDNAEFIAYLRDKGFYVADQAHSNYAWTSLSLASTLNMQYLPPKASEKASGVFQLDDSISDYDRMVDNSVKSTLQGIGYEFVDISTWNRPLGTIRLNSYDFYLHVLRMTVLARPLVHNYLAGKLKRGQILERFNDLKKVPGRTQPIFVYAHFMIPHHPYVFDENGNLPPFQSRVAQITSEKDLYLGQLIFANKETQKVIESILSRCETEPIIVIQGDHGAYELAGGDIDNQRLRMGILSAYYLPETCKELLYDSITPVNTFRVILNCCFGASYPLLQDKIYFSTFENKRDLTDVTGVMQE